MRGTKQIITSNKTRNNQRNPTAIPKPEKHKYAISGKVVSTTSSEDSSSDGESAQNISLTTSPTTSGDMSKVTIDPASFLHCFNLALSEDAIVNKLSLVLQPLLESRDKEIAELKEEVKSEQRKVTELEIRVDELSQWTRNDSIIISGIRYEAGESNEDCENKFIRMATDMGVKIQNHDINNIHRLQQQKNGNRSIIVRLTSHKLKVNIMKSKKNLRTNQGLKHVFINEALTPYRANLFYEMRTLVKEKKIKASWTRDGQIYARDLDDQKTIIIRRQEDIKQL